MAGTDVLRPQLRGGARGRAGAQCAGDGGQQTEAVGNVTPDVVTVQSKGCEGGQGSLNVRGVASVR